MELKNILDKLTEVDKLKANVNKENMEKMVSKYHQILSGSDPNIKATAEANVVTAVHGGRLPIEINQKEIQHGFYSV